jgi:hypothetical protein
LTHISGKTPQSSGLARDYDEMGNDGVALAQLFV